MERAEGTRVLALPGEPDEAASIAIARSVLRDGVRGRAAPCRSAASTEFQPLVAARIRSGKGHDPLANDHLATGAFASAWRVARSAPRVGHRGHGTCALTHRGGAGAVL